ncbi:ergot alkaloid biosynthesis protein [Deinococcus sp.]|uniref:ergot alkaloid biosynthesis protein n=1 Tax=Deinococcus sp. TaxID=47478 RepID=UPI003B5B6671
MSGNILVTGGTGKTGAALMKRLTQAGHPAISASRTAMTPGSVRFDWDDAQSHDAALNGVSGVYLVAPIGSSTPIDVMEPFVKRALSQGVQRFVLLSSSLIDENGPAMGAVHALLKRHAPQWAVLRPSWFMENFSQGPHAETIVHEDAIYSATDDGVVPFVAVDDIAEVAQRALTDKQAPNTDLIITGPVALSFDQVAEMIGAVRGRAVKHIRQTQAQRTASFQAVGVPPEFANMLSELDRAIAHGAEARTTSVISAMTGRAPTSFAAFAAEHSHVWR